VGSSSFGGSDGVSTGGLRTMRAMAGAGFSIRPEDIFAVPTERNVPTGRNRDQGWWRWASTARYRRRPAAVTMARSSGCHRPSMTHEEQWTRLAGRRPSNARPRRRSDGRRRPSWRRCSDNRTRMGIRADEGVEHLRKVLVLLWKSPFKGARSRRETSGVAGFSLTFRYPA
jgi:hypothetical protein